MLKVINLSFIINILDITVIRIANFLSEEFQKLSLFPKDWLEHKYLIDLIFVASSKDLVEWIDLFDFFLQLLSNQNELGIFGSEWFHIDGSSIISFNAESTIIKVFKILVLLFLL